MGKTGSEAAIVVEVKDDSMEPRLHAGQRVRVVLDPTFRDGLIAFARCKESGQERLRVLRRRPDLSWEMEALRPGLSPVPALLCTIVGYVVAIQEYAPGGLGL